MELLIPVPDEVPQQPPQDAEADASNQPDHHNLFEHVGVLLLWFGDGSLREVDASQEGRVNVVSALLPPPGRQSRQLRSSTTTAATLT